MIFSRIVERTRFELEHIVLSYQTRKFSLPQVLELFAQIERLALLEATEGERRRITDLAADFRRRITRSDST